MLFPPLHLIIACVVFGLAEEGEEEIREISPLLHLIAFVVSGLSEKGEEEIRKRSPLHISFFHLIAVIAFALTEERGGNKR